MNTLSNCLVNIHVYTHWLVMLSALAREFSFWSREKSVQGLIFYQSAENRRLRAQPKWDMSIFPLPPGPTTHGSLGGKNERAGRWAGSCGTVFCTWHDSYTCKLTVTGADHTRPSQDWAVSIPALAEELLAIDSHWEKRIPFLQECEPCSVAHDTVNSPMPTHKPATVIKLCEL